MQIPYTARCRCIRAAGGAGPSPQSMVPVIATPYQRELRQYPKAVKSGAPAGNRVPLKQYQPLLKGSWLDAPKHSNH